MMKNDKILIVLNKYNIINAVANYGFNLAKQLNKTASFYVVKSNQPAVGAMAITGAGIQPPTLLASQSNIKHTQKQLDNIYEKAIQSYSKVEYSIDIGNKESNIISKAKKELPFMVIVESQKTTTTYQDWFGTTQTRIAEESQVPVLVLPNSQFWRPVKKILYLMDVQDSKTENLKKLTKIAQKLNAYIDVVLMLTDDSKEQVKEYNMMVQKIRLFINKTPMNFHRVYPNRDPNNVQNYIQYLKSEWLVFQHQDQSFFERILDEQSTQHLILNTDIPTLVI